MQSLDKRIAALERAASPQSTDSPRTIVLRGKGADVKEIHGMGQSWPRLPGETVQELTARASREVRRNGQRCVLLTCR